MRRWTSPPVGRALLVATVVARLAVANVAGADEGACTLSDLTATPATCRLCHPQGQCHPCDVDYGRAATSSRGELRSADEVVRRGLVLLEGRMNCHTCHDAGSWWAHRLVIPPGSRVSGRVMPGDQSTYDPANPRVQPMTVEQARATLPRDTDLSPKPLCLACHARD